MIIKHLLIELRLLALTLLLTLSLNAQESFKNAIITYANGTTKKGFVKFENYVNPNLIIFKQSLKKDDPIKEIVPNQISSCTFTSINREIIVEIIDKKKQFLEVIIKGKSSLLFHKEIKAKKRYFLKSEKTGLKELLVEESTKNMKKFKYKKYIGILNIDFNDCSDISSKIEKTSLTLTSLSDVFITYNTCTKNLNFKTERLDRKDNHKIEVETGMYSTQIKPTGNSDNTSFDHKLTPYVGIQYIYTPTFLSSRISLSAGISYFNISTNRNINPQPQPIIEVVEFRRLNTIEIKALNYQFGIVYNFGGIHKKLRANFGAYYVGMAPLNSKQSIYRKINNEQLLNEITSVLLADSAHGVKLQIGINYKIFTSNKISAKLAYQRMGDLLLYDDPTYPFDSFIITIGYNFNL